MDLLNVASIVSSGILDKSLGEIGKKPPEGILELVPMGIGEIIPEGITERKFSCVGLGVSIPDEIFEKKYSGKTFSILFPDLIDNFPSDLEL